MKRLAFLISFSNILQFLLEKLIEADQIALDNEIK